MRDLPPMPRTPPEEQWLKHVAIAERPSRTRFSTCD